MPVFSQNFSFSIVSAPFFAKIEIDNVFESLKMS